MGVHETGSTPSSAGALNQSLRYDPWGTPRSTAPAGYSPFRFQGSWHDGAVDLAWVVTRWYAPTLGRFVSEDQLLGEPIDPASRHLYAYGAGEPVGQFDPDGRRPDSSWTTRRSWKTYDDTLFWVNVGSQLLCWGATAITLNPWLGAGCAGFGLGLTVYGETVKVKERNWYRILTSTAYGRAVRATLTKGIEVHDENASGDARVRTYWDPRFVHRFEFHFASTERGLKYFTSCWQNFRASYFINSVFRANGCWTAATGLTGGQLATSYRRDGYKNPRDSRTYYVHSQSKLWPRFNK